MSRHLLLTPRWLIDVRCNIGHTIEIKPSLRRRVKYSMLQRISGALGDIEVAILFSEANRARRSHVFSQNHEYR